MRLVSGKEKLSVSSDMGCLNRNQKEEEEEMANKVAGQQWWAISSLGRQLKGKNPDEEEKEEEEKELEVILLSNRKPKVEQLGETEVCGFSLVSLLSGDIF